jgi:hypothetical protein
MGRSASVANSLEQPPAGAAARDVAVLDVAAATTTTNAAGDVVAVDVAAATTTSTNAAALAIATSAIATSTTATSSGSIGSVGAGGFNVADGGVSDDAAGVAKVDTGVALDVADEKSAEISPSGPGDLVDAGRRSSQASTTVEPTTTETTISAAPTITTTTAAAAAVAAVAAAPTITGTTISPTAAGEISAPPSVGSESARLRAEARAYVDAEQAKARQLAEQVFFFSKIFRLTLRA